MLLYRAVKKGGRLSTTDEVRYGKTVLVSSLSPLNTIYFKTNKLNVNNDLNFMLMFLFVCHIFLNTRTYFILIVK